MNDKINACVTDARLRGARTEPYANQPPLFSLGTVLFSARAMEALAKSRQSGAAILGAHVRGLWRDMGEVERRAALHQANSGGQVVGRFLLPEASAGWIHTITDQYRRLTYVVVGSEALGVGELWRNDDGSYTLLPSLRDVLRAS